MALLVKSDTVSTKNLGSADGLRGPQDWKLNMDFESDVYLERYQGEVRPVPETIRIGNTRNTTGLPKTKDKNGVVTNATANSVRTWLTRDGRFGLLTEDTRTNYFLNSATPATQTISMPASGNEIIVSCIGSGNVTVTGANLNESGVIVTQNNSKKLTVKTAVAHDVTVTCSGTLTHVQVEIAGGFPSATSPITTLTAITTRNKDNLFLNNDVLARALANLNVTSDFTVITQTIPYDLLEVAQLKLEAQITMHSASTSDFLIAILRKSNSATQRAQSSYATAAAVQLEAVGTQDVKAQKWGQVTAMRLQNKVFSTVTNGSLGASVNVPTDFKPTTLYMGQGHASPVGRSGVHGIITKLVIFDRALTDDELKEITKSWN